MESIYILTNRSLPDMVKIGRTDRSPHERANELSTTTGVPTEYEVFRHFAVVDSVSAETRIHERLKSYRVAANREFFRIDPETAATVIEELFPQQGSVAAPAQRVAEDGVLRLHAKKLIHRHFSLWPGLLKSELNLSYDEADALFRLLVREGTIDEKGEWILPPGYRLVRKDVVERKNVARAERQRLLAQEETRRRLVKGVLWAIGIVLFLMLLANSGNKVR